MNEGDPPVNYRQHIGGGCFVSVTTGFKCVDFRQFYVPYGDIEIKPTRKGIALRLAEWDQMRKVIDLIDSFYPALADNSSCYLTLDH